MKRAFIMFITVFCLESFGVEISVIVRDDKGVPVVKAEVSMAYGGYSQAGDVVFKGNTDSNGWFSARGKSITPILIQIKKEGFYGARYSDTENSKSHDLNISLPRILSPIPLLVATPSVARYTSGIKIPGTNQFYGFDFKICDWVAPYGKGVVSDVNFRLFRKFGGWKYDEQELAESRLINKKLSDAEFSNFYGKWDAELEVGFGDPLEGIVNSVNVLEYSELKMPYEAPVNGYISKIKLSASNYSPNPSDGKKGWFLRTRVRKNERNEMIGAHYSKIVGDIQLHHTGFITFTYYFNPIENERNLEFNPKKNLFSPSFVNEKVFSP